MDSILSQLSSMKQQIASLMHNLNISDKAAQARALESAAAAPDFWDTPDEAQRLMQQMAQLNQQVEQWDSLLRRIEDALELGELGSDMFDDLSAETESIRLIVDKMALQAMLAGEYDSQSAVLAIHAGAGGVDAQDWAQMLERMYLRWVEQNGYKAEILERSDGEEAGLKSVMMSIRGEYAYGYLRSEAGVHRLVRLSPFDAASRRHTSFAKVELWPDLEGNIAVEISEKDLRIDTYRSSGAGGQNVQKNDTAVRITHLPTGIVISCQNQRSQLQNRERAMQVLKARLLEIERQKKDAEISALKGDNIDAGWGNQIRSYVLHPYQLVKDHRTSYEVGNTAAVLDGRLGDFMAAYLRWRIGQANPATS